MAQKKTKVEFLKSPTGKYGLAYYKGDEAFLDPELAEAMFKDKTAKPAGVKETKKTTAKK